VDDLIALTGRGLRALKGRGQAAVLPS
jgi:hypothetical protein